MASREGTRPRQPGPNSGFLEECADSPPFFPPRAMSALPGQTAQQNVFNKRYWYLNLVGGWIEIGKGEGGRGRTRARWGGSISWLWIFMKFWKVCSGQNQTGNPLF